MGLHCNTATNPQPQANIQITPRNNQLQATSIEYLPSTDQLPPPNEHPQTHTTNHLYLPLHHQQQTTATITTSDHPQTTTSYSEATRTLFGVVSQVPPSGFGGCRLV